MISLNGCAPSPRPAPSPGPSGRSGPPSPISNLTNASIRAWRRASGKRPPTRSPAWPARPSSNRARHLSPQPHRALASPRRAQCIPWLFLVPRDPVCRRSACFLILHSPFSPPPASFCRRAWPPHDKPSDRLADASAGAWETLSAWRRRRPGGGPCRGTRRWTGVSWSRAQLPRRVVETGRWGTPCRAAEACAGPRHL
ncbi:MAG: hypothetical protein Q8P67_27885 [archaeon]|nr:hypothetical protein [archaeon]